MRRGGGGAAAGGYRGCSELIVPAWPPQCPTRPSLPCALCASRQILEHMSRAALMQLAALGDRPSIYPENYLAQVGAQGRGACGRC